MHSMLIIFLTCLTWITCKTTKWHGTKTGSKKTSVSGSWDNCLASQYIHEWGMAPGYSGL